MLFFCFFFGKRGLLSLMKPVKRKMFFQLRLHDCLFFVSRFVMMVFKSLLSMFVDQKYPICSDAFVPTVLNGLNKQVLFLFEHVSRGT